MYYVISEKIALRSWKFVKCAFYIKNQPYAHKIDEKNFELLLRCDGMHDIEPDELTENLEKNGMIRKCEKGEKVPEWSAHKSYPHRYFPKMNLMITGKCNYNCLHCFNAADNAPIMTEWSFDDLLDLLDQARGCGVNAFTITGGEPMLHPRFMDIIREIYKRDMFVEELNTNGFFITQEILDEMKSIGCLPLMKISFDGIGCHDWMRDRKGAEERTLAAIELCVKNGFRVMSQTQVHRRNLHTIMPTAVKLNDMGVSTLRLIRTTEVPRWEKNCPDSCLGIEEYFGKMLEFMYDYKDSGMKMNIVIWQFMKAFPADNSYKLDAVNCTSGKFNPTVPICRGNRGMIAVTSGGDVVPCMQMSGYLEEHGIHMENLHTSRLVDILTESKYMDMVCADLGVQLRNNQRCMECKYYKYCNGGCPALGLLYSGEKLDFFGSDITKCLFYENGWYQKAEKAMEGWTNTTHIDELSILDK